MRGHRYRHRKGLHYRDRGRRSCRYYTRQGCLLPILSILIITAIIIIQKKETISAIERFMAKGE